MRGGNATVSEDAEEEASGGVAEAGEETWEEVAESSEGQEDAGKGESEEGDDAWYDRRERRGAEDQCLRASSCVTHDDCGSSRCASDSSTITSLLFKHRYGSTLWNVCNFHAIAHSQLCT